jgi:DNA (cytosine-5)-methyltransferase 1
MFNPVIRERHTYWANFYIPHNISNRNDTALVQASRLKDLCDFHDYDFKKYKGEQRILKMARNLVDYEAGKTILETALNIVKKSNTNQTSIFDEM